MILKNLDHRGAVGADPKAGDGCGILTQIPHEFFLKSTKALGIDLPDYGYYGVGNFFMPKNKKLRRKVTELIKDVAREEGLNILGWRDIPVDNSDLGKSVIPTEPFHAQIFINSLQDFEKQDDFERKLFVVRKRVFNVLWKEDNNLSNDFYISSLSSRTILYKGMVLADQKGFIPKIWVKPRFQIFIFI